MKNILQSIFAESVFHSEKVELHWKQITPVNKFKFPWGGTQFMDVFPESYFCVPSEVEHIEEGNISYDLIVIGYQPWFLSPSIPVSSFLQSEQGKQLLKDKPVITVVGCRNMWINGQEKVKKMISDCGGRLKGNIVLQDNHHNLISLFTVIGWQVKGIKEKYWGFLPPSGVSESDIQSSGRFGPEIMHALITGEWDSLQNKLKSLGAVKVNTTLMLLELVGNRMFRLWATLIRASGKPGSTMRNILLQVFMYYLIFAIFIGNTLFSVVSVVRSLFFRKSVKAQVEYFSGV